MTTAMNITCVGLSAHTFGTLVFVEMSLWSMTVLTSVVLNQANSAHMNTAMVMLLTQYAELANQLTNLLLAMGFAIMTITIASILDQILTSPVPGGKKSVFQSKRYRITRRKYAKVCWKYALRQQRNVGSPSAGVAIFTILQNWVDLTISAITTPV